MTELEQRKIDFVEIQAMRYKSTFNSNHIAYIRTLHDRYLSHLKKNICWDCPQSIRVALFDLYNYIDNNPIKEDEIETENNNTPEPNGDGTDGESIPKPSRSKRSKDN